MPKSNTMPKVHFETANRFASVEPWFGIRPRGHLTFARIHQISSLGRFAMTVAADLSGSFFRSAERPGHRLQAYTPNLPIAGESCVSIRSLFIR